jgi:Skp family chaperone for outer membrane proteins
MLIVLFKEIQEACQRVAMAQGYDLVLHYNDATTSQEYWSAMNIARKLQAGACMPLHYGPGVEITNEVVNALNSAFTRTAPGAATGGAPAAAPGVTTGGAGAARP